jgi:4-carboxymuconolactone decarboxylase
MNPTKYEQGMAVRREVLGDAYVDRAMAAASEFMQPMQELVAENCWGHIWTRPGLPRKTRSLITLATLAALRASSELKLHVLGALRNGCTPEEIQEVLLQSAVYCGVPAGIEAFRAAREVVDAWKQGQTG